MLTKAEDLTEVKRVDWQDVTDFFQEYQRRSIPVIITGLTSNWPAKTKWSLRYFGQNIGDRIVEVYKSLNSIFIFEEETKDEKYGPHEMSILEFIGCVQQEEPDHYFSVQQTPIQTLKELEHDICMPEVFHQLAKKEGGRLVTNFWIGAAGTTTGLHFDGMNGLLTNLVGTKEIILFDPYQTDFLYPYSQKSKVPHHCPINAEEPDYERYPLFRKAASISCVLRPYESLFIPSHWWHQIKSIDLTISVNSWWPPYFAQCIVPAILPPP